MNAKQSDKKLFFKLIKKQRSSKNDVASKLNVDGDIINNKDDILKPGRIIFV